MIRDKISTIRSMEPRKKIGLVGLVTLFGAPAAFEPLEFEPYIIIPFFMIFAMTWDFQSGYTGQLNFGHAMFIAVGGYTSAILNSQHGLHVATSIPLGVLAATLLGVMVGLPALRLKGQYLSLLTLIVPIIMYQLVILWSSELVIDLFGFSLPLIPEGTGGQAGLTSFPEFLASTDPNSVITVASYRTMVLLNYYAALLLLVAIGGYLYWLSRSKTGGVLTAIREDENAVVACGINPAKFKLMAFINSAATAGLAGAVFVHTLVGSARPTQVLTVELSINIIIMAIIGGLGTIVGAAVGGLVFGVSDIVFNNINTVVPVLGMPVSELTPLPFVIIGLAFLLLAPEGITPTAVKMGRSLSNRYRTGESAVEFANWSDAPVVQILRDYLDQLKEISRRNQ
jgi:branched-chain amino acid transport system permease protein